MTEPSKSSMTCRVAEALIPRYLSADDPLPLSEARRLERHLASCDACQALLDKALDQLPEPHGFTPLPTPSDDAMHALIAEALARDATDDG